jgi:hypothetical protein
MGRSGPSLNSEASCRIIADYGGVTARDGHAAFSSEAWRPWILAARPFLRPSKSLGGKPKPYVQSNAFAPQRELLPCVTVSFAAIGAGALLPIQFGINSQLARVVGSSLAASAVSFRVGTVALTCVAFFVHRGWPAATLIKQTPLHVCLREVSWARHALRRILLWFRALAPLLLCAL